MQTLEHNRPDSPADTTTTFPIKFNANCVLSSLSAAQQEQLFDWLELNPARTVLELVAAPPPEGFGLRMHLTTLRRVHRAARTRFHANLAATELELIPPLGSVPSPLDQEAVAGLREFAVELATVQQRDPLHFATVSRWVLRLEQNAQRERQLKIAENRLALLKEKLALEKSKADLEKTKFEFNSARAALHHLPDLKDIVTEHPGDSEDKIWAAREKLFPPRSDLVENPNLQSTDSTK
jgi:hypothetical protein